MKWGECWQQSIVKGPGAARKGKAESRHDLFTRQPVVLGMGNLVGFRQNNPQPNEPIGKDFEVGILCQFQ